jgi:molecular chaperone HtpG
MAEKTGTKHTYKFKAEVKQLLDILVHSLYTSREIFLRELISNTSDALDKLRFETTRNTEIENSDLPLEIRVDFDEKKNTLTISDTGVGMTKDELVKNIGTIAKSGSAEFLKNITENKEDVNNIIGKFGVGFYSVFMVAKEVVIKSKSFKPGEPATLWKSDGTGSFVIEELTEPIKRGTIIEIHLKDDAKEFAEKFRLESAIKLHSNFISFPIFVGKDKINTVAAIWREPRTSIKKEQYVEFYKFLTYDTDEPMYTIHKSVDAPIQFNALMFIPKKSDEFFWMDRENYGLDLYVRRVLIQRKNKDLLPEYLSFVKGVVDSEDLPLNISRETLQENSIFSKISSSVTNHVLSYLLEKAKNAPEEYIQFWKEHGKVFKLGYMDFTNLEKYQELLRFNSSECKEKDELISLADYVARMKEDQKEIYFAVGGSREAINLDPHLEIFIKKGLEVLYLFDPVDEIVVNSVRKYKEHDFVSVDTADLKKLEGLKDSSEEKEKTEELSSDDKKHFFSLLSKMKSILAGKVEDVKESHRLSDSASCLVSADDSMTASMHRLMKMANRDMGQQKKILEINPDHKMTRNLLEIFKADSNDEYIVNVSEQLYESALLLEGALEDPHNLVRRINELLEKSSEWYLNNKTK